MTASKTISPIEEAVRKVGSADADQRVRVTRRIEIGHCVQQGDVYVFRVPDDHPRGGQIGAGLVQVALGTGNGARHVADGAVKVFAGMALPEGVKSPMEVDAQEITGPVIVASAPWSLTHPEHPHHKLPAGVYQVIYQFDRRTMRRVVD
jgi:hypothetical protein